MKLTKEDCERALEALENMDDYARMGISIDPYGPYGFLLKFIKEVEQAVSDADPPD